MAAFKHLLFQTHCRFSPPPRHLVSLLRRPFSTGPAQPPPSPDLRKPLPTQNQLRYVKEVDEEESLHFPKIIKVVKNSDQISKKKTNSKKKTKVAYDLKKAIRLVKASGKKTFDETLEAHAKMTPELHRRTDLKLRGFVRLPHDIGKTYRVAVFAQGAAADEAREAGADIVGGPELVERILSAEVKVDFDMCFATPSMMEHVKKLAECLKQLMPNLKKGTMTDDISRAVKQAKECVLFKKDKSAIVHIGLGKLSFSDDALRENVGAFVNALLAAKPIGLNTSPNSNYDGYVDTFHICSTMGASYPITTRSLSRAADHYSRLNVRWQSERNF